MRGKPFEKGDPRAGRPAGTLNKYTREARLLAQSLVTDAEYLAKLKERLINGKASHMETVLWQYAYGPPSSTPITPLTEMFEHMLDDANNGGDE